LKSTYSQLPPEQVGSRGKQYPGLNKDMSFADQLPNRHFLDKNLNEKILMSGPLTIDSDSEFNRHSTIMSQMHASIP
jgi:hypothetical protein